MSKFFIQMLLSIMVGIGAAFGFNPHLKSEVHDTWQHAGVYLHEATDIVLKSAGDLKTSINARVSIQAVSNASAKTSDKVDVKVNGDLKVKNRNGQSFLSNLLSSFSLDSSATTQTLTSAGADTSDMDVKAKNKTQSTLTLNLGIGK